MLVPVNVLSSLGQDDFVLAVEFRVEGLVLQGIG